MEPRKFITVLTSTRHLSLSWANPNQSPQPLPTSSRSVLILSSHLRLGLPDGLYPSSFPTKTLCKPRPSSIRATCPAHLILLDFITRTVYFNNLKRHNFSVEILNTPGQNTDGNWRDWGQVTGKGSRRYEKGSVFILFLTRLSSWCWRSATNRSLIHASFLMPVVWFFWFINFRLIIISQALKPSNTCTANIKPKSPSVLPKQRIYVCGIIFTINSVYPLIQP